MKLRWLSIFLFFPPVWSCFAASTSLHVSNGGSDANPGTLAAPLSTLQQAISNLTPADFSAGHVFIWLHSGVHNFGPTVISNAAWTPGVTSNLIISGWTNDPPRSAVVSNTSGDFVLTLTKIKYVTVSIYPRII